MVSYCVTQEAQPSACNNLEGWVGVGSGGNFKWEGAYVYLWLIHITVWQKPTQHYKAIILQLKIKKKKVRQSLSAKDL